MRAPRVRVPVDTATLRAVAAANPRLREFVVRMDRHPGGGRRAGALLEHLLTRILDDAAGLHLGPTLTRLERVADLRATLATVLDHLFEEGRLPPGRSVESLMGLFDELSVQMRELSRPRQGLAEAFPLRLTDEDALVYAQSALATTAPAGGRHLEPDLRSAVDALPAEQRAALRQATALEPDGVLGVLRAEEQQSSVARAAALETRLGGRLTPAELADLRAALEATARARNRAAQVSPQRLAPALAALPDPALRAVVGAADPWILPQLAMHNPRALTDLWEAFRRRGGQPEDGAGFRAYVRHEMTTYGRSVPAEFTAAFSLTSVHGFLKGPDVNTRARGTDLVAVGKDGWYWLIDDKSHGASSLIDPSRPGVTVGDVSALTTNLTENLRRDAAAFRSAAAQLQGDYPGLRLEQALTDAPGVMESAARRIEEINMTAAPADRPGLIRAALAEHRIRLRVTSAMGNVVDLSDALKDLGLTLHRPGGG